MSHDEFMKQQYLTLRDEIRCGKARNFWLVIFGTLLVPAAGLLTTMYGGFFATATLPFVVLVIMLAFVAEQNDILRAGRYLREHVEPTIEGVTGWEKWLESHARLRGADRVFFGSFVIIFTLLYALSTRTALQALADQTPGELREQFFTYGVIGYIVGGVWFFIVLIRHWQSCTTTRG
ncbi:MAG: hypothetical protein HUU22_05040 [Phycisphaerae bacterium]|nr:hypothetical protein [Phycisphaerae bacterium]NUQ45378.1 hypothetical protein [Phycisphaerae bacterium]